MNLVLIIGDKGALATSQAREANQAYRESLQAC